jgi:sporulation protein YlmC with PRC-barrel domain
MESNEINKTTYLQELSGSDFEIADNQPNIIGWEIVDELGDQIGEVKDLIFDSSAKKVRYVVAELDFELEDGPDFDSKSVLIPIGMVDLDDDDEIVTVTRLLSTELLTLPSFESGKIISPVEELAIRHAFLGNEALPDAESVVYDSHPEDFYLHGQFDNSRFAQNDSSKEGSGFA